MTEREKRRSRRAKLLGQVEDVARALAREDGSLSRADVVEMVEERLERRLNHQEERAAAFRAYDDVRLR